MNKTQYQIAKERYPACSDAIDVAETGKGHPLFQGVGLIARNLAVMGGEGTESEKLGATRQLYHQVSYLSGKLNAYLTREGTPNQLRGAMDHVERIEDFLGKIGETHSRAKPTRLFTQNELGFLNSQLGGINTWIQIDAENGHRREEDTLHYISQELELLRLQSSSLTERKVQKVREYFEEMSTKVQGMTKTVTGMITSLQDTKTATA